jgi:PIN domain nuclease of toxin-antitoxin system
VGAGPVRGGSARRLGALASLGERALRMGGSSKLRRGALSLSIRGGVGPHEWYAEALEFHGIRELPVTGRIALESTLLPTHHRDPCDRIIVATAREESLRVVTPDLLIAAYEVETSW